MNRSALRPFALGVVAAILVIAGLEWLHDSAPAGTAPPAVDVPQLAQAGTIECERLSEPSDTDDLDEQVAGTERGSGRTASVQIIACPDAFDGRRITLAGEVVGDVLRRADGAWVQLNDDEYGLGEGPLPASGAFAGGNTGLSVWLPGSLSGLDLGAIGVGSPGVRGDVLVVRGTVWREDPEDGGGLTVRADRVDVAAEAIATPPATHVAQLVAAVIAVALGAAAVSYQRQVNSRR